MFKKLPAGPMSVWAAMGVLDSRRSDTCIGFTIRCVLFIFFRLNNFFTDKCTSIIKGFNFIFGFIILLQFS